jgi:hypothetical protein
MSISNLIFKFIIPVILAILGLALIATAVGVNIIGAHLLSPLVDIVVGICILGLAYWLYRGGVITA